MRPDASLQARTNRRRIRRNTLRIFQDRARRRWVRIVRRSRTVTVGETFRNRSFSSAVVGYRSHRRITCRSDLSAGIGAGQLFNPGYGGGMHHA